MRATAIAVLLLLGGCSGKTTSLVCTGTMQRVGEPETRQPVSSLAASVTKYPFYVKAWSDSYGEFRLSDPYAQHFSRLDDLGDQIMISEQGQTKVSGTFNKINGSLKLAAGNDLFEVECREVNRITP
ncbi:MAG: hypothetical protein Q7V15_03730 [Phenylobacterium sp.]|uniref:hypothetical protein n=1 Tax=Phenylobacterium sp. TaxID=1871053 RepID=UPI0027195ECD|nr:hypothetical protein [Phenylobacterium sp.]MDO8900444.1 hypothetical protein [Phenylobacterium sp.]